MNYTIYCDLDGVLVDFAKGYEELTGINTRIRFVKDNEKFWAPVNDAGAMFWATLDWMPDGQQLWRHIKKYKPYLLSAPSLNPSSSIGKKAWVKIHIPNSINRLLLYPRHEKQQFTAPDHILIDDLENTITEWRARGGIGIHHTSASNTILQLKKLSL